MTKTPSDKFEYAEWLVKRLEELGDEIERAKNIDDHIFKVVKTTYLSSVIDAEMMRIRGEEYDDRLRHIYEDDRTNFLFYRMFFKLLYDCEQGDGKALQHKHPKRG